MTNIPVLFITFARPEYARKTFDAIKLAKPSKLYFYSNIARNDRPDEVLRNNEIRNYINEIDWECDLITYFRTEHVDVYTSLWSALDWVFSNEEQAIIFEEDCVPSLSFFDFCEQLLLKYKNDLRVWVISGNNFYEDYNPNGFDYIFTRFPFQYGWASWKSRWEILQRENIPWEKMKEYQLNRQQYGLSPKKNKYLTKLENKIFLSLQNKPSWDFTFGFNLKIYGAFGIIPTKNLVSNIGAVGENNTTGEGFVHNRKVLQSITYPIENHPPFVIPDYKHDQYFFEQMFYKSTRLKQKIKNRIKRFFK